MGEYVGQFIGDYIFQVSVALVVMTGATAAWIILRRRRYVKLVEFKRVIEALRIEFRRSIDEARAAARRASAVSDKLLSVIEPIDTSVTDLNARLASLEEHADAVEAFMARPQKNALQESEQIAGRLLKLEQKLTAFTDQISLIEHTIDGASRRDQKRNNSIDASLKNTQMQMEDLFRRLDLGEQARADLGSLISLFVKQLKRVNITSAETVVRVAELESLRAKIAGLEERLGSTLDPESHGSAANLTKNNHTNIGYAQANPSDEAGLIEPSNQSVQGKPTATDTLAKPGDEAGLVATSNGAADDKPTATEEPFKQPFLDVPTVCENSFATGANGHA